jgi:hypothetical protein
MIPPTLTFMSRTPFHTTGQPPSLSPADQQNSDAKRIENVKLS